LDLAIEAVVVVGAYGVWIGVFEGARRCNWLWGCSNGERGEEFGESMKVEKSEEGGRFYAVGRLDNSIAKAIVDNRTAIATVGGRTSIERRRDSRRGK
jgi:hypothetical protein